jgi:energy-coupling factor transporter ATP-binding protein EcfA2
VWFADVTLSRGRPDIKKRRISRVGTIPLLGYNGRVLKKIRLKNFKLHEDTSIDARRITVFIGPNNSGKSSIFQALLILRRAMLGVGNTLFGSSAQRTPTTPEHPFLSRPDTAVDIGEFEDVVRGRSNELQIRLEGELPERASSPAELFRGAGPVDLAFSISARHDLLTQHDGWLRCNYGETRWSFPPPVSERALRVNGAHVQFSGVPQFSLVEGRAELPPDVSEQRRQQIKLLAAHLATAPKRLVRSLRPVFALRGFEEWAYPIVDSPGKEDLDRMVLSDRAMALTNLLAANAKLRAQISERLKSLIELGIEFETASLRRVKVWATSAKSGVPETLFVNEGSGANQLPFILVPIALAQPGEAVLLSEPEAHLHPSMQSAMTAMLLRASKERALQFFVETHSEHILHRLLHAVANGELALNELTVHYFENKNGKAEVRKLMIDEKGGVEGGLPGFFDQSLDELSEYLEALKQPKS